MELRDREITPEKAVDTVSVFFEMDGFKHPRRLIPVETAVYFRAHLFPGDRLKGPALIVEDVSTIVIEPGWNARIDKRGHLLLQSEIIRPRRQKIGVHRDPVLLEVFNNLFMSIAEQMGLTLQKVSHSTNIKERLDFSCALFDGDGKLVANAPHIPVHLGAMGESVSALITARGSAMKPGEVYATNDPYHGGSHLPDITVVTPVYDSANRHRLFFVASRGHHADIGGMTPGSMPPFSKRIDEEGVLLHNFCLVQNGRFREKEITEELGKGLYPARDIDERLDDLRAAIAANSAGVRLLLDLITRYGSDGVLSYMHYVRENAEESMRRILQELPPGRHTFTDYLDDGAKIAVAVTIEGDSVHVDFSGTDPQVPGNLNAPYAVVTAAVLYVFRTLISHPIPLNAGCLNPIRITIPRRSLLHPQPPAAVAAGNVETSMRITDVLFGALEKIAAGQGTMNNLTFGSGHFAYYETICGGSGAGYGFDGVSAVHTHMTNTRATDPEVLERRYPVVLRAFAIRRDSGGSGVWKGGNGVRRELEFLQPMTVSLLSERRKRAPFGLHGGGHGKTGRNTLEHRNRKIELPGKFSRPVEAGDVLIVNTPGGGGYNPSKEEWGRMAPETARRIFHENRFDGPTAGIALGYLQANLIVIPARAADDFEDYCRRNTEACPLLERLCPGDPYTQKLAACADIRTDLPRYRIHTADSIEEVLSLTGVFRDDFVTFLLGCSYSFEDRLIKAGLTPRHIEQGVNVPMYRTTKETKSAGIFSGPLVVSMRPIPRSRIGEVYELTRTCRLAHGAPVYHGDPRGLGIADLSDVDWGHAVEMRRGEIPVFWACGVTSQVAVDRAIRNGGIDMAISHAPGHMFISDVKLENDLTAVDSDNRCL